jgi:hypothetical protein
MKKIIITCLIAFCLVSIGYSQDYKTGMGIRAGIFDGLTLKYFLWEQVASEIILDTRWRGVDVTVLYEMHKQAFDIERLKCYYGGGGHIGIWNGNYIPWGKPGSSYEVMGVDGILGLEYSFKKFPFNMGIDWKPVINIIGIKNFWIDDGALSMRYIF